MPCQEKVRLTASDLTKFEFIFNFNMIVKELIILVFKRFSPRPRIYKFL